MFVDRYYLQSHRMVWAAAGFVVGLLCMESSGSRWWALLLLLGALCCWYWRQEAWQQGVLFFVMVLVGCAVLQGQLAAQQTMTPTGDTITVQGRVTESREGQGYFWLQVENPSAQWTRRDETAARPEKELLQEREVLSEKEILYVSVPRSPVLGETEAAPVWYPAGSQIMVTGVLAKPQRQRNPGGFDEALWLRSKQARYQLQAQNITVLQEPQGVWRISLQLRNFIERTAYRCLPAAEADTALALLLGEKQRLEQSFYRLTQRMGTAHIFAVSGLHVGFVGALLLYGLRLVGGSRSWLAFLLLSVVLFLLFVDWLTAVGDAGGSYDFTGCVSVTVASPCGWS